MELNELDTDSMLGKTSGSVASMSIKSGSGGVKVMGGNEANFGNAPTFEMRDDEHSSKKDIPKFKPTEKKKKNMFKIVD